MTSDEERETLPKRRKRKAINSGYYKGSRKRIKQKDQKTSSSEDEIGFADPTISYVFIRELANNLNTEDQIKRG